MKFFIIITGLVHCALVNAMPEGFSSIKEIEPQISVEIRYFGANNFVGDKIDGYLAPKCVLSDKAAKALAKAQKAAAKKGLTLKVFDCYRPQMAVDHFVRWAKDLSDIKMKKQYYPKVKKSRLFSDGYIASKSGHSRGSTVDLTLARNGEELDMGTPFDFFDPLSHTENPNISSLQMKNRILLRSLMESAGFKNYKKEWWHYSLNDEPHRQTYFNFSIR